MTTFQTSQVREWIGRTAYDNNGDKIGSIEDIYEDDQGGGPEWVLVSTGLFGGRHSFAPISGATPESDGLRLAWDKDTVKGAPNMDADGSLSQDDEQRLYSHYRMGWDDSDGVRGTETTTAAPAAPTNTADSAMTRSEEELDVSKRTREAGRARLRKWVETENVEVTVPVRREVAKLVTEPITDANRDAALSGPDITENEYDVVLTEEEVVVDKKVVPKERVRLETESVEETRQVSDQVRKERIAMDDDKR
jgi:uncharacterized protein (TIGR02271 family)